MDAIWQITYITNQFLKEDDVFIYVMRSSEIDTLEKPAEIYPGFCLNMIEIFKTDFVRSNLVFPSNQNYTTAIEIMLDSVFFIRLPEKLQGFTIFNRNILINRKTDLERSNFKLFCGYIFVLILHESAHYFLRISYKKDKEWFEHSTPTTSNEAGNDLERVIFGDVLEHITFRATNYILNVDNWNKRHAVFKKDFNKLNTIAGSSAHKDPTAEFTRFKTGSSAVDFLELGCCPKNVGRMRRRELNLKNLKK